MAKKRNDWSFLLLSLGLILLILAGTYFFNSLPVASKEIDVKFIIGENYGIDLNRSALTFGKIIPGGDITRYAEIKNDYNFPVRVRVFLSKNIEGFIRVDSGFVLGAGENISLPFNAYAPADASEGNYTGKARIVLYRK